VFSVVVCWVLVIVFGASDAEAISDEYEAGDNWIYDCTMNIDTMVLSGLVTESFEGLSTKSVGGYIYTTYEMKTHGVLAISGSFEGFVVSGSASITDIDSVDTESLNKVVSDVNLSMTISVTILGIPVTVEAWEHNVTTYSPPGGLGDEPDCPFEGQSWTKSYTVHYESTSCFDGDISSTSGSVSETVTYTYLGEKSMTVPAGTFFCDVIQQDHGEGISTDWYNSTVGMQVKSAYEEGSNSGTMLLMSYSYTPPDRTPPSVVITGPEESAHLRGAYFDISWESSDNVGVVLIEVKIDDADWSPATGSEVNDVWFPSGYHVVQVRATDQAGNQAVASVGFSTDNRALSFGGPYYALPIVGIVAAIVIVAIALVTMLRRKRAIAESPSQELPPGTQ